MNDQADIQVQKPLTEATFLILLSMAQQPKHGYAIMKDVRSLSRGRVALSTGTLYGALKRLLDDHWIERVDEPGLDDTGRQRKAYSLIELGRRILVAETSRMRSLVAAAQLRTAGEHTA